MKKVHYKSGYKYQLSRQISLQTKITPAYHIDVLFISLTTNGLLTVRAGYASDGPSGPTLDTKNFMRAAFVHDALYQLIRMGELPMACRLMADELLYQICREDGMSYLRAKNVLFWLRRFGKSAADPKNKKREMVAP